MPDIVAHTSQPVASNLPIVVQPVATARILAGAEIRLNSGELLAKTSGKAEPTIRRDNSGTLWAEFS